MLCSVSVHVLMNVCVVVIMIMVVMMMVVRMFMLVVMTMFIIMVVMVMVVMLVVMSVLMHVLIFLFTVHLNGHVCTGDSAFDGWSYAHLNARDSQRVEFIDECLSLFCRQQLKKCSSQHVASRPHTAVYISCLHLLMSLHVVDPAGHEARSESVVDIDYCNTACA